MASGDVAALYGFTPVAATDDIRLGYDAIDRVADFAAARMMRSFTSKTEVDKVAGLFTGALAAAAGVTYRWNGTAWLAWESDWTGYASTWAGIGASASGGQWRYTAGKVRLEQAVQASGNSTAVVTASLPVNARQTPLYSGVNSQSGWWGTGRGNLFNGNDCDLAVGFASSSTVKFGLANSSRTLDTLGGSFTVGSGNGIRFELEYDPA